MPRIGAAVARGGVVRVMARSRVVAAVMAGVRHGWW